MIREFSFVGTARRAWCYATTAGLGIWILLCGSLLQAQEKKDEAQEWLKALDMGGRAIFASLILTVVGIVIVYLFVGRFWRDIFALLFCIGFQFIQEPRLLTEPVEVFEERWKSVETLKVTDSTMAMAFFAMLGLFFAIRAAAVFVEIMGEEK